MSPDHPCEPELQTISEQIQQEAELRFFVDGTKNLGHQVSTMTLIQRCIAQCDYRGHVRIIYADYNNPFLGCTAEKLALLFQGLDRDRMHASIFSIGSCVHVTFWPYHRRDELLQRVKFGFTGGADNMSVNYAAELNVDYFCRIQPYCWDDLPGQKDDVYYQSSCIECHDARRFYLVDALPEFASLVVNSPEPPPSEVSEQTWDWYQSVQDFDPQLRNRVRNAYFLQQRLQQPDSPFIWPIYGLQHFREQTPFIALNCVSAACRLMKGSSKPVALASFTPEENLEETYRLLNALAIDMQRQDPELSSLSEAIQQELSTGEQGAVTDVSAPYLEEIRRELREWVESRGRLFVLPAFSSATGQYERISDALQNSLPHLQKNDLLWVGLGPQPQEIFQFYYSQADIPGIIEGQASANYLLSNGIPFIQLIRKAHSFTNCYPLRPLNYDSSHVVKLLNGFAAWIRDRCPDLKASDLKEESVLAVDFLTGISDKSDRDDPVDAYFQRVKQSCQQPGNDKFLVSLVALSLLCSDQ
ncbi:hypothetical protein FYZ48_25450 [Gimesia chilikensis]|uniref:hypothetical protein n=1 Tax=Gimesia chilikensis TaxID=2605989 RepID=UPI0011EF1842|nr:hypothetical protein [Gimesia chilikensis]KAA0131493.1 hypothetical protein FYZ48_25450 [Gimesia chilikensis]